MARQRHRPSSIKTLPPELLAEIERLCIKCSWTIDQITDFLAEQGHPRSRSAVGRHTHKLHLDVERAGEALARSAAVSKALMERFGDKPDNELARLNIQLLHGQVFDLIMDEAESMGAEEEGEGGGAKKPKDALQLVRLSKAVQQLLSGEKMNAERVAQIRKESREEENQRLRQALEAAGATGQIDADAMARAKRALGFD